LGQTRASHLPQFFNFSGEFTMTTTSPASASSASASLRFDFSGRVAVVTGGANGIGQGIALALAQAGARVAVWDANADAAQATVARIEAAGGCAQAYGVDVSDAVQVEAAMQRVHAQWGRIDQLINNAGLAIRRPTLALSVADWNRVLEVNLTGVFLCAQQAARFMVAQGSGCVVNTASIMGLSGGGLYPNISYQSTKGAVVNLTRALAVEWASQNIRVNAIAPTWVRTGFIEPLLQQPELVARIEAMTPMARLADIDDVVGPVLFLCSDAARMITGHTLPVDGGFLAQ
jgi:NAD(P)-dependent dehydrogenase (short-subunit alcohol dehydrogenase family)